MTIEEFIDKLAALFMFMTFPLLMTGAAASTNQPHPNAIVEGTGLTVMELSTVVMFAGFGCFMLGGLIVLSLLFIPRQVLQWEPRLPQVKVEW